jgi:hypothetical protein
MKIIIIIKKNKKNSRRGALHVEASLALYIL